jgi:hypothetical protein
MNNICTNKSDNKLKQVIPEIVIRTASDKSVSIYDLNRPPERSNLKQSTLVTNKNNYMRNKNKLSNINHDKNNFNNNETNNNIQNSSLQDNEEICLTNPGATNPKPTKLVTRFKPTNESMFKDELLIETYLTNEGRLDLTDIINKSGAKDKLGYNLDDPTDRQLINSRTSSVATGEIRTPCSYNI